MGFEDVPEARLFYAPVGKRVFEGTKKSNISGTRADADVSGASANMLMNMLMSRS